MIPKPLDEIEKPDIDALVTAKTSERRTLEYKEALPGGADEEKKEFLYDVSSLANAAGGDLIFGITDQKGPDGKPTGVPESATGVPIVNVSAEIARLENILQSSVAPRIPSVQFREVAGFPNGVVLVLRAPKSWAAPHMVTYKNVTRFYSRNSTGKYPLDVHEIRSAFALSETLPDRLKTFRQGRLSAIVAGETPIPVPVGAKLVLHIVPAAALSSSANVDVKMAAPPQVLETPAPIAATAWDTRFNFDGLLIFSPNLNNYVQLFRSGAIEAVDTTILEPYKGYPDFVPVGAFERQITAAVVSYLAFQRKLGLVPPIFVMLTLIGVKGFKATTGPQSLGYHSIDRDILILPDVAVENFEANIARVLKPIFDTVAQSAGLRESPGNQR
jgi:hypothetical protein